MVDCIDIKVDEGILVKDTQISNVESSTEETVEDKEEQVQESKKEDSESDNECVDTQQQSVKPPSRIIQKNHSESQIIGDRNEGVQTRRKMLKDSERYHIAFLSISEPKNFYEVSEDEDWIKSMNEELDHIEKE